MEKKNYQRELDGLLEKLGDHRPRLLLHSCCGPCSSYVIDYLKDHFDLAVLFYNPQIFPDEEYAKRLDAQKRLARVYGVPVLEGDADETVFLACAKDVEAEPEGGKRCSRCFFLRLDETARRADQGGFDYFASTLSVSPHKDAQKLNVIGESAARRHGVLWLPSDFKKRNGYRESVRLAKEYGLYRQDYCGCRYSIREEK